MKKKKTMEMIIIAIVAALTIGAGIVGYMAYVTKKSPSIVRPGEDWSKPPESKE